jgi:hypothetical protein
VPSNAAPLNATAVEQCLTQPGGVRSPGSPATAGCGSIFQHVETCYEQHGPWDDPYNQTQSGDFQACLCQTKKTTPFNENSMLWQNFTGCANCLGIVGSGILLNTLSTEWLQIENFCSAEYPNAFMVISGFENWLAALNSGLNLSTPPLTGPITQVGSLSPLFTTIPPLANLAWGQSAPPQGTLAGVTPELMTQTIVSTPMTGPVTTQEVTVIVQWVPTAATSTTYDPSAAAVSAQSAAASGLAADLSSLAAIGQGGPTGDVCHGKCPKKSGSRRSSVRVAAVMGLMFVAMLLGRV